MLTVYAASLFVLSAIVGLAPLAARRITLQSDEPAVPDWRRLPRR
jgi:hypothetical protein